MATDLTQQTEAVLAHHLQAMGVGIEEILIDYTEDSILFTPNGPVRGLSGLRGHFEGILKGVPSAFWEAFKVVRQDIEDETAYILWKVEPFIPLGADTFVVRNGKIKVQTVASFMLLKANRV